VQINGQTFVGGDTFKNLGTPLPAQSSNGTPITYQEYDVNPYQPGVNRGGERIVVGSDGSKYYTDDHYSTFKKVP
jgi:guanyl-specific ribonuclease Sa